ncbi:MAG: chemotaxis protein CheA [Candidatus Scalindua sp. AMX11]|nr:MAG: chemotaxis protein CheA [Candidatus Scalindua sp.]NOG85752.1 chemotaxis protein CheA [Planctomycetota bacterium]RZV73199.1 MAG: chemotaxis protein CheA [Candidatus Scalindua sp. SCAELEC01]TDE64713.1 MAG: chemotaxis protein CheA [Candidatus Scalindua sp. AMX11]GJQ58726.1 MAG: chemotaxis protein CheA [Candidatus Scalindua sp.]
MSDNPETNEFTLDIKEDSEIFLEFLSEAQDHLEESESNILSIDEDSVDYELINAIFRSIHSIKGSAGFLGLSDMQKLSHELETLLDKARKGEIPFTKKITTLCLDSIDILRTLRENLSAKVDRVLEGKDNTDSSCEDESVDIQPTINNILYILNEKSETQPQNTEQKIEDNTTENEHIGEFMVNKGIITQEQLDIALKEKGRKLGEILVEKGIVSLDIVNKAIEEQKQSLWKPVGEILVDNGTVTERELKEAIRVQERKVGEILIDNGATTPEKINSALNARQAKKGQSRTVKVDTNKLDNLFDLVGELVIANTLISGEMKSGSNNENRSNKNLSHLSKITKDIQDQVMSMRMVSLKQTFQKMSRLVRDVSMHANKEVELIISGEDTELDKNVIEEIADPLVHILRNSVDHGIEPEEKRIASGKTKQGTVKLSAYHRGGNIIIQIQDDGKGLQKERILKKAIDKGLIKEHSEMSDNQIYNLIFSPGLSTAEKITNISGRGVGMDVVKKNIEKLRGKVEVISEEGKGSTFTIKLPLTLAIIDGIVVNVGSTKYIIPTISISESLRPKKEEISTIKNQGEVVNMRGNLFPLVRLHKLYNIDTERTNPWEAIVVIVETEEGKFSILVDELLGQQQVVIKNLGETFKGVKGISGGAILGDGKVGLILDVSGIKQAALAA